MCPRKRGKVSDKIDVRKHPGGQISIWWYEVASTCRICFRAYFLVESVSQELPGTVTGEENPDPCYWRWIPASRQGVVYGGAMEPPKFSYRFLSSGTSQRR